jgi:hypothetical protein
MTGSSPTTQASCPGSITDDWPAQSPARFVFLNDVHGPRLEKTDVVGLAALAAGDGLDSI